jgi:hypothetical protein
LYNAVLACQPAERSGQLDKADPEVRREVELLLAQKGSLLDHSAWEGVTETIFFTAPRRYVDEKIGNERQLETDFVIEIIYRAGELLDIICALFRRN